MENEKAYGTENDTASWAIVGDGTTMYLGIVESVEPDEGGVDWFHMTKCRIFRHALLDMQTPQGIGTQTIVQVLPFPFCPDGVDIIIAPILIINTETQSGLQVELMKALENCKRMEQEMRAKQAGLVLQPRQ